MPACWHSCVAPLHEFVWCICAPHSGAHGVDSSAMKERLSCSSWHSQCLPSVGGDATVHRRSFQCVPLASEGAAMGRRAGLAHGRRAHPPGHAPSAGQQHFFELSGGCCGGLGGGRKHAASDIVWANEWWWEAACKVQTPRLDVSLFSFPAEKPPPLSSQQPSLHLPPPLWRPGLGGPPRPPRRRRSRGPGHGI